MRDPNRLDSLYAKLLELHTVYCPDLRFGQFIIILQSLHGTDLFYLEDEDMEKFIEERLEKVKETEKWVKQNILSTI